MVRTPERLAGHQAGPTGDVGVVAFANHARGITQGTKRSRPATLADCDSGPVPGDCQKRVNCLKRSWEMFGRCAVSTGAR